MPSLPQTEGRHPLPYPPFLLARGYFPVPHRRSPLSVPSAAARPAPSPTPPLALLRPSTTPHSGSRACSSESTSGLNALDLPPDYRQDEFTS
uniref:Uncharacterized protein n=1 Tax=Setaria viridis TaxID=4556 RepID=A0A4U6VDB0_SETVI|nr:hypothetical protein SEVIR_3G259066v2 [Setaria viridis]